MFSAPTRSAWSVYPQRTHWNFSCVGRFSSATCAQSLRGQVREVLRGFTGISLRPALSALCARMPRPGHPRPPARRGAITRVDPVPPTDPGIARLLPGLDPPEERGERLVEAPQRGLLAGERPAALALRVERPDLLKLRRLVPVADAGFRHMPVGGPAFLQRPVIERAVIPKHLRQRLRLLGRRAEEELKRAAQSAPPSPSSPKDLPP